MDVLPGAQAPELQLGLASGETARVGASGQAQLLFFFNVECPTSPLAAEAVERLRECYGQLGKLEVIAVSQDEPVGTEHWVERHRLQARVALEGSEYPASRAFGLVVVPSSVLLDGGGRVLAVQEGWSRQGYDDLARAVAAQTGQPFQTVASRSAPAFRPG
jgi:peroxiredoxin